MARRIPCIIINTRRLYREVLRCAIIGWKHSVRVISTHCRSQANVNHAGNARHPPDLGATVAIAPQ
jgi:hypothetical protein